MEKEENIKYYCETARKIIVILFFYLIIVIFDKPLMDFIWGDQKILNAFCLYDYSKKEWLIGILNFIVLVYFILVSFDKKRFIGHIYDYSKIFSDVTILLISVYYLSIRNEIYQLGGISFRVANYTNISNLKYVDLFIGIITINSILNLAYCFYFPRSHHNSSIWVNDGPLENFDNDNDLYSRKDLALKISEQINQFSDHSNSFTLGIVSPWGTGKTSFLNQIKVELENKNKNEKYKSNLILNFNPWQYPDETNLTKVFLREIEIKLRRYIFSDRYFNDYINQLFKNNKSFLNIFFNAVLPTKNIEELHNSIKKSILKSKKRFVIFIDDIDRLQSNEIYEILTIIRNIGNLPNTVFVLAYDKDYLLKTLEDKIKDPQEFLSKFFQVEFSLSKIQSETLKLELFDCIDIAFPDLFFSNKTSSQTSTRASDFEGNYNMLGLALLKNHRDIIRLMNAIKIIWPVFKNEILFIDFLKLEILRLKYGNVYTKIKNKDSEFINLYDDTCVFTSTKFNIILMPTGHNKSEEVKHPESTILKKLVLDNNDTDTIMLLLGSLFPLPIKGDELYDSADASGNNDDHLSKRAVKYHGAFNYYFQNAITGISLTDLNNLR